MEDTYKKTQPFMELGKPWFHSNNLLVSRFLIRDTSYINWVLPKEEAVDLTGRTLAHFTTITRTMHDE